MAVSQVTSVNEDELIELRPKMIEYMKTCLPTSGLAMLFAMLTNIIDESTVLVFAGEGAAELVAQAFQKECDGENYINLPGVVSRKKQIVSPILAELEDEEDESV